MSQKQNALFMGKEEEDLIDEVVFFDAGFAFDTALCEVVLQLLDSHGTKSMTANNDLLLLLLLLLRWIFILRHLSSLRWMLFLCYLFLLRWRSIFFGDDFLCVGRFLAKFLVKKGDFGRAEEKMTQRHFVLQQVGVRIASWAMIVESRCGGIVISSWRLVEVERMARLVKSRAWLIDSRPRFVKLHRKATFVKLHRMATFVELHRKATFVESRWGLVELH